MKGNARAVRKTILVDWVVKEWKSFSQELIMKSFRVRGQVADVNIDEIACLKEGKSLSESNPALQYLMSLKPDESRKKVDDLTIDFEVAEEEDDLEE